MFADAAAHVKRWRINICLCIVVHEPILWRMSGTTDLVRRIRARGLTQTEIERRTGIPQPRLSRWEAGKEVPVGADDALRLAHLEAELIAEAAAQTLASTQEGRA